MYYNINFDEFHKKETENRWKAMESGWNGDLWQKLCNESAEKHLKLLDQHISQKKLNLNNVCRVFCFNEAIFKGKLEKVLCNLELELNTDIYYDKSTTKIDDVKFNSIQSNLKVFNYDKNDKGKIISFFKNHGFKYQRQNLHDRLIFKYVSCLFE
jgi:hypothetical protein